MRARAISAPPDKRLRRGFVVKSHRAEIRPGKFPYTPKPDSFEALQKQLTGWS